MRVLVVVVLMAYILHSAGPHLLVYTLTNLNLNTTHMILLGNIMYPWLLWLQTARPDSQYSCVRQAAAVLGQPDL
jgi:hypothetical protein